jgi:hypothetical protein
MIYLRGEGGQYVGPFKGFREVERFIKLMELCGENWTDTEVVEQDEIDSIVGQTEPTH